MLPPAVPVSLRKRQLLQLRVAPVGGRGHVPHYNRHCGLQTTHRKDSELHRDSISQVRQPISPSPEVKASGEEVQVGDFSRGQKAQAVLAQVHQLT